MRLKVKKTKKYGRGVYTLSKLNKNELVFSDEVLIVPLKGINQNNLISNYWYHNDKKSNIISLGLGSLLNHSSKPNIRAEFDVKTQKMSFYSLRDIKKDEQLFLDYGYDI